jgi:hypothetical protein
MGFSPKFLHENFSCAMDTWSANFQINISWQNFWYHTKLSNYVELSASKISPQHLKNCDLYMRAKTLLLGEQFHICKIP